MLSCLVANAAGPLSRVDRDSARRRWPSISTGRFAGRNALIATSTAMSPSGGRGALERALLADSSV